MAFAMEAKIEEREDAKLLSSESVEMWVVRRVGGNYGTFYDPHHFILRNKNASDSFSLSHIIPFQTRRKVPSESKNKRNHDHNHTPEHWKEGQDKKELLVNDHKLGFFLQHFSRWNFQVGTGVRPLELGSLPNENEKPFIFSDGMVSCRVEELQCWMKTQDEKNLNSLPFHFISSPNYVFHFPLLKI